MWFILWNNSLAAQFRSSLTRIAKQQNWPLPSEHTTQPTIMLAHVTVRFSLY
jgi:hypothetical protein